MSTLGEAYLQIGIKGLSQYKSDLKNSEGATEASIKKQQAQADKAGQRILASLKSVNQQRLRDEKSLNASILSSKKSLNQQRLSEEIKLRNAERTINKQRLRDENAIRKIASLPPEVASKKSLNQQRLVQEQNLNASILASRNALTQQRLKLSEIEATRVKALNQKKLIDEQRLNSAILVSKKALNQQRISLEASAFIATKTANNKRLMGEQKLNAQILASKKALNQQRIRLEAGVKDKAAVGFLTASKNILKAAPAFAVATAAIGAVHSALRGLRDEFIAGLVAVEDYQLKVASMSAFLTTFNDNLTKTNAAEIYRMSNKEAKKLVTEMEILDARTIATGKDLTTMAEQFIKGGVKINIANQATKDGFVNIANALKLLTKGQNQEIQMRQEIRALTQGQLRDQNILVKTLQGIDPRIKEHIKLWKQQGTLIKNVGSLLAGFGPAAKELENTWAVIGTTMETIHTRILRGAFRPTYESLVSIAKKWNGVLMDSKGNLTSMAKSIQGVLRAVLSLSGALTKSVLFVVAAYGVGGTAYLAFKAFGAIIALATGQVTTLTAAFATLTGLMMRNPYFALGAVIVGTALGFLLKEYLESMSEIKEKIGEIGREAEERLAGILAARKKSEEIMGRVEKRPTGESGVNIIPFISSDILSPTTVDELLKPLRKLRDSLRKKTATIKEGAVAELEARLASTEFADALYAIDNGGSRATDALADLKEEMRKYAQEIDKQEANKKAIRNFESLAKSLATPIDKFKAMRNIVKAYLEVIKDPALYTPARFQEGLKQLELIDEKELNAKIKVVDKFKKKFAALRTSLFPDKALSKQDQSRLKIDEAIKMWDGFTEAQKKATGASSEDFAKFYDSLTIKGTTWLDGAQEGLKKYSENTTNIFEGMSNMIQRSFKGMEDAIVDFVKTGKFNFSDMVDSMISDLIRLMVQQSITAPLAKMMGGGGSGGFGSLLGGIGSLFMGGAGAPTAANPLPYVGAMGHNANGNVFGNTGVQAFANGGAFTNSIVSSPTVFPFANGTGLMGERGPEAIMPLERNSKGQLGVVSSGSKSNDQKTESTVNINIAAVDAKSFQDLADRNPGAIIGPFIKALQGGDMGLRSTLQEVLA